MKHAWKVIILFAELLAASGASSQEPWTPHAVKHISEWDHKNVTRYPMPLEAVWATNMIQNGNSAGKNTDRPVVSFVFPSLMNTKKPNEPASWANVEAWQWQFEPTQGGGRRWVWNLGGYDVSQWRIHHSPLDGTGRSEAYTLLLDTSQGRNSIDLCTHLSAVNFASFGDQKVRVWGDGRLELGYGKRADGTPDFANSYKFPATGELVWREDQIVWKDNKPYTEAVALKVAVQGLGGKLLKYRIKLEPDTQ